MAKKPDRFRRSRQEIRDREGHALSALGARRGARRHRRAIRAEPAHGRTQALAAARRQRRLHQPRRLAHLERLLCLRDPARQEARAAAPALRGDDPHPRRPRLDQRVERRRQAHHLRMEGGRHVRDPAQLLAPAFQRLRPGAGALCRRHQRAVGHQPLRRHRFRLQHALRLQEPLRRRARLLQPKAEKKGFLLVTNFVPDAVNLPLISAKERGAGGGHIRFNMAKGSMSSHISQFPVGTYKKAHCHGPSAHVIILSGEGFSLMWHGGRGAAALRLAGRHADRAAEQDVPSALQHRADAGALSRLQARGRARSATRRACRSPGSAGASAATRSTMPTSGRRSARMFAQELAKHGLDAAHGRRLQGRACRPAAEGAAERGGGIGEDLMSEHHRSARACARPCADQTGQFLRRGAQGVRAVPQGL